MKIQILKQTFVKGQLAKAGDVIEATQNDGELLIGMGKAIASAEKTKKPEHKEFSIKKKLFSRKKKQELLMKKWINLAKANPKISVGIAVVIIVIILAIF